MQCWVTSHYSIEITVLQQHAQQQVFHSAILTIFNYVCLAFFFSSYAHYYHDTLNHILHIANFLAVIKTSHTIQVLI